MTAGDKCCLFVIGAILGGVSGALASTANNDGNDLFLWSTIGAVSMAFLAVGTRGRILSLLFLKFDLGSPYTGHKKGEWKQFWILMGFLGIFVGAVDVQWIDRISSGMLYIVLPSVAIVCFGIGYLIHELLKDIGCIVFGVTGLAYGAYGYLTAFQ